MKKLTLSALLILAGLTSAAAEWSGSPYSGRQDYHISGRASDGAEIQLRGRDVEIAPQGECWLTRSAESGTALPPGARAEFIPFRSRSSFESYRQNNTRGRQAQQCAFNMPVELCGATAGQTGHRALGTVVGPFTYDTGTETVTLTLRADRQGTSDDYGWSVASQSGSCAVGSAADCSDADYAAAHPDQCSVAPRNCDNPQYIATHPEECSAPDPYCPAGYTTHVLLSLVPIYYDESGAAHGNPHTLITCARTSPTLALATPTSCRYSQFQLASIRHTSGAAYGFPNVGFCGYDGSLDTRDYNVQWGDFPTFCAHDLGAGSPCLDVR